MIKGAKMNVLGSLRQIFALPKYVKIFLGILSIVAVAGLCISFGAQNYVKDKEFSANLTFHELEKYKIKQLAANMGGGGKPISL